jgi:hypothetical protein
MSHSRSLRSYDDVKEIFDEAVARGGIRVTCTRPGQAINLRARLNHFRQLDRDSMAQIFPADDPRHGCSAYDPFMVRLVDSTLIIELRQIGGYTIEPLEIANEKTPQS